MIHRSVCMLRMRKVPLAESGFGAPHTSKSVILDGVDGLQVHFRRQLLPPSVAQHVFACLSSRCPSGLLCSAPHAKSWWPLFARRASRAGRAPYEAITVKDAYESALFCSSPEPIVLDYGRRSYVSPGRWPPVLEKLAAILGRVAALGDNPSPSTSRYPPYNAVFAYYLPDGRTRLPFHFEDVLSPDCGRAPPPVAIVSLGGCRTVAFRHASVFMSDAITALARQGVHETRPAGVDEEVAPGRYLPDIVHPLYGVPLSVVEPLRQQRLSDMLRATPIAHRDPLSNLVAPVRSGDVCFVSAAAFLGSYLSSPSDVLNAAAVAGVPRGEPWSAMAQFPPPWWWGLPEYDDAFGIPEEHAEFQPHVALVFLHVPTSRLIPWGELGDLELHESSAAALKGLRDLRRHLPPAYSKFPDLSSSFKDDSPQRCAGTRAEGNPPETSTASQASQDESDESDESAPLPSWVPVVTDWARSKVPHGIPPDSVALVVDTRLASQGEDDELVQKNRSKTQRGSDLPVYTTHHSQYGSIIDQPMDIDRIDVEQAQLDHSELAKLTRVNPPKPDRPPVTDVSTFIRSLLRNEYIKGGEPRINYSCQRRFRPMTASPRFKGHLMRVLANIDKVSRNYAGVYSVPSESRLSFYFKKRAAATPEEEERRQRVLQFARKLTERVQALKQSRIEQHETLQDSVDGYTRFTRSVIFNYTIHSSRRDPWNTLDNNFFRTSSGLRVCSIREESRPGLWKSRNSNERPFSRYKPNIKMLRRTAPGPDIVPIDPQDEAEDNARMPEDIHEDSEDGHGGVRYSDTMTPERLRYQPYLNVTLEPLSASNRPLRAMGWRRPFSAADSANELPLGSDQNPAW